MAKPKIPQISSLKTEPFHVRAARDQIRASRTGGHVDPHVLANAHETVNTHAGRWITSHGTHVFINEHGVMADIRHSGPHKRYTAIVGHPKEPPSHGEEIDVDAHDHAHAHAIATETLKHGYEKGMKVHKIVGPRTGLYL